MKVRGVVASVTYYPEGARRGRRTVANGTGWSGLKRQDTLSSCEIVWRNTPRLCHFFRGTFSPGPARRQRANTSLFCTRIRAGITPLEKQRFHSLLACENIPRDIS